jgi:hypothetical protein
MLTGLADAQWLPVAAGALALSVAVWLLARSRRRGTDRRRPPAAVVVAALAAAGCTAYSADTSWRFAAHRLGMTSDTERAAMFAAAELALFAVALMARQNLNGVQKAPGTPGILVWVITGVQVIPAYSESGVIGGTVRAFVGPVLAALLWHLAMGIELRHAKPGANSQSLPAVIARELRERMLSRLGLATRNRTAEQISRDRATAIAVKLASRPTLRRWGRSRLAAAVARSGVGTDAAQRDVLLQLLAARRGAISLATIDLRSPFEAEPDGGTNPGTTAEPVPARVVLVPVPARDRQPVPAPAEPRPELQAVPEPVTEAEPKSAPEPARRTRRATPGSDKGSAFNKHVRAAQRWLSSDPAMSGADIGKKLGTSDRYGRKVRTAALAQAS